MGKTIGGILGTDCIFYGQMSLFSTSEHYLLRRLWHDYGYPEGGQAFSTEK